MTLRPHHHRKHASAALPAPIPNWTKLARADEVAIYQHGEEIASGHIDMLSMDGSVLWLIQDAGRGRALFLHSDGAQVFRRPKATTKQECYAKPRALRAVPRST